MGKVYIVTSGEYSDYSIEACFSTRALAEAYLAGRAQGQPYHPGDIEEFSLDEPNEWKSACTVRMKRNGYSWGGDLEWEHNPSPFVKLYRFPVGEIAMECKVLTDSKETAVKVANEKRTQLIALGQWRIRDGRLRECIA